MIEIWQPRWKDRTVLIACYKVGDGWIHIRFTKTKSMPDKYRVSSYEVRKCPITTNGTLKCYAVPLDILEKI